jgi:hypothetical protein
VIGYAWQLCAATPHARAQDALTSQVRVGIGAAQRGIDAPSADGLRRLDFGPAPAVMLEIDSGARVGAYQLGVALSYRTSVLGRVRDVAAGPGADSSRVPVRSHHFEGGARGRLAFGADPRASTLGLFVGYGVRAFSSVAVLRVPAFSLHGPVARLELELQLPAALRLRLAPELAWLPSVSRALREASAFTGNVWAIGGAATLMLPLGERFDLLLDYRESHAWTAAYAAQSFSDVERYLLLGVAYAWL